jgi:hypothetical protein
LICQYVVFFHLVFFHCSHCKKNYKFRIYKRLIDVSTVKTYEAHILLNWRCMCECSWIRTLEVSEFLIFLFYDIHIKYFNDTRGWSIGYTWEISGDVHIHWSWWKSRVKIK